MKELRAATGMTQAEAERASGVSRDYIGSVEGGRIKVMYPDMVRKLAAAYRQPGYVILEAMGFETNCTAEDHVLPALSMFMSNLDDAQQKVLLEIARATFRASQANEDGHHTD